MSEDIIVARHQQICDLCYHHIEAGERCRLIRDDFWRKQVWFEHLHCPNGSAVLRTPKPPQLTLSELATIP